MNWYQPDFTENQWYDTTVKIKVEEYLLKESKKIDDIVVDKQ